MKKLIIVFVSIILVNNLYSQMEHILMNMDYVPQSSFSNPAIKPKTKFHFGIGAYGSLASPISYNDIISKKVNDTIYLNGNEILSNLNKHNFAQAYIVPDFSLGVGIKKGYFMVGARENIGISLSIPFDFFEFIIKGNAQRNKIGQPQNVGDFRINGMHYREYFASASFQILPKWQVGLRLKYLIGFENISTQSSDVSITTDPNSYALTLQSNILINTSGLSSKSSDRYSQGFFHTSNTGFGVDLGGIFKYSDKLSFGASINDIGYISWKEDNKIIRSKKGNSKYVFDGLDLYNLVSNNNINYIDNIQDTIKNKFEIEEVVSPLSYTTGLRTRLMINAEYKPIKNIALGGMVGMQVLNSVFLPSASLFARADVYKILQLQMNYQVNNTSLANLGIGIAANLGPIQYYLISDNIIGSAIAPLSTKNVNIRTGLNFQWSYGKDKKPNFKVKDIEKSTKVENPKKSEIDTAKEIDLPLIIKDTQMIKKDSYLFQNVELNNSNIDVICPNSKQNTPNQCPDNLDVYILKSGEYAIYEKNSAVLNSYYQRVLNKYIDSLTLNLEKRLIVYIYSSSSEIEKTPTIGLERNKYILNIAKSKGLATSRVYIILKNNKMPEADFPEILAKEFENCLKFEFK